MDDKVMDTEVMAVLKITEALGDLDESARRRVLQWAMERFCPQSRPATPNGPFLSVVPPGRTAIRAIGL